MTAYEFVVEYNKSNSWDIDNDTIYETLQEEKQIYAGKEDKHRWYSEYLGVVNLDGTLIGYTFARTHGDMSAREMGWEFDIDSICYVERIETVVYSYIVKE
jgi:hypothetical protein